MLFGSRIGTRGCENNRLKLWKRRKGCFPLRLNAPERWKSGQPKNVGAEGTRMFGMDWGLNFFVLRAPHTHNKGREHMRRVPTRAFSFPHTTALNILLNEDEFFQTCIWARHRTRWILRAPSNRTGISLLFLLSFELGFCLLAEASSPSCSSLLSSCSTPHY